MIKIKSKIPVMYLFFYCNLRNHAYSNIVGIGEAERFLGKQIPRILRKHIIQEMIDLSLLERVNRKTIKIVFISKKVLDSMGVEIAEAAVGTRNYNVEKDKKRRLEMAGLK